jgi:alpha-beta hydrolase superfamily lysophospholipase
MNVIRLRWSKPAFLMKRLREISSILFLLVLLAIASGCSVSRLAANQIVTAPNLQRTHPTNYFAKWWTNFFPNGGSNPLVSITIPVGPPEARLRGIAFPPRDYHWKFESTIATNRNGKRNFSLTAQPETNHTFAARAEPATVILLHGYGMTKESMVPWAFVLAQAGYRVVTLDLRGHGESTGARIGFGRLEAADLSQALDYLIAHGLCDERVAVMGISYGATMALHWAARDSRLETVIAIAPYNQPDEAIARFAKMMNLPVPQKTVQAGTARAATKLNLKWKEWSAESAIRRAKCPVLLIGGEEDPICPPEDIRSLERAGNESGSVRVEGVIVPQANHFVVGMSMGILSRPIKAWLNAHLIPKATAGKNGKS